MRPEGGNHRFAIVVALALAALVGVVAIASIWANRQLLDTGGWVAASGRMLESRDVRHGIAVFLGEELVSDTEARLEAAGQDEVAALVMPRLRRRQAELAERVIATRRFRVLWRRANRSGHRALVRALDEEGAGRGVETVVVDLTPALRRLAGVLEAAPLARELGAANLAAQVEPGAARIKVLEADELDEAQDVVRVVRHLTLPAVLVALGLYAIALLLGRRRLAWTGIGVGTALAATAALALLARTLAGHAIVDRLLTGDADRRAAEAAWRIATSEIADLAGFSLGLGTVIVLLAAAVAIVREARARSVGA